MGAAGAEDVMAIDNDDARRTAALAYWRYAHDYFRAAADLCRDHQMPCGESQVPYHLCAQGLEFAFHAYLRAHGVSVDDLQSRYRHALDAARAACESRGLPALPTQCVTPFTEVAGCLRPAGFRYLDVDDAAAPDVAPLLEAGTWILAQAAPHVSRHYVEHLGGAGSPTAEEFGQRLRTALTMLRDASRPA
jgi:hypothetical protein